tara:strand:- start:262 stop:582 length:321 start_codon:yes stop_codon:yes gene_type:complete
MGFLGVYKAIYDYVPQGASELAISEGDILYVLEKSTEDDWWKAKKKASGEDDDEPTGLVPSNYVEEVCGSLSHSDPIVSGGPQIPSWFQSYIAQFRLYMCQTIPKT